MNSYRIIATGSRDEQGFINNLDRNGMTRNKGMSELIANSSDARSAVFIIKIGSPYIKCIDVGTGATERKIHDMFAASHQNHAADKSMGVSGEGGLISGYILSKTDNETPRPVYYVTKHADDTYYHITAPWDRIKSENKYDGKIEVKCDGFMKDTIDKFLEERKEYGNTGMTVMIPYSDSLKRIIESQFYNREDIPYEERWSIIFGKSPIDIYLDKGDNSPIAKLLKYDYMCGNDIDYYTGRKKETYIKVIKKANAHSVLS